MNSINKICEGFAHNGNFIDCKSFGDGHVNDTYLVRIKAQDEIKQYVLQRISSVAFGNCEELMKNVSAVSSHIKKQVEARGGDTEREALSIIPTLDGKLFCKDKNGECWRMLSYVSDSVSYTKPTSPEQIYKAAFAFGNFQRMLRDFDASSLYETIPDFHNTGKRFSALLKAAESDRFARLESAIAEFEFAKANEELCYTLNRLRENGELPIRVTHNDTKLNNVLFDKNTDNPICVIDLDTVMPGLSVNDFGDAVRSSVSSADEDERDLSRVDFSLERYELLVKGFLDGTKGMLTERETEMLPVAALTMTLECGIRFLTDYLLGDVYFKTHRPMQNLDRAKVQFKLLREMQANLDEMRKIVNNYSQKEKFI